MGIDDPVQRMPMSDLIQGVCLAWRLLAEEMTSEQRRRIADRLDEAILELLLPHNVGVAGATHSLLLFRRTLEDGTRSYQQLEDLVREVEKRRQ